MIKKKVGIFVPVYHRDNKTKKSISSLLETEARDTSIEIELSIYIGINGASQELLSYIEEKKQEFLNKGMRYEVFKSKTNIGKPKIVNIMVECLATEIDYVISYDSDMIVTDPYWVLKFVKIFESYKGDKKIGALCSQQSGNCCHVLDKDPFIYTAGDFTLITRAGNEGVAGGVLVTPFSIWESLGGYMAHRVYASDDAHYALSCANNNLLMAVVKEIEVYHPFEDDSGYVDWKARAARDLLMPEELGGYFLS